jgi:hypothetical protein
MKAHYNYLKYVLRHKWFVFWACLQTKAGIWLGIIHDLSKFSRAEWVPYVHQFFNYDGSKRDVRDKTGAYDPAKQSMSFQMAWMNHQRNKHHWQSFVSIGDGGTLTPMKMPIKYIREMVADWIGAGRAQNSKTTPQQWYEANKDKMVLHPESRQEIENILRSIV